MRDDSVIDEQGFRPNVGIMVANTAGQLLWGKRIGQQAWQFPQGGIHAGETPEQALYRELNEEVGLQPGDVKLIASTKGWLRYRLPGRYRRPNGEGNQCIGQKQRWFLLQLTAGDDAVVLDRVQPQEFDDWQWVSYWYPLSQVIVFKREVYRRAMKELLPHMDRITRSAA